VQIGVYAVLAAVFMVPQVRHAAFKSQYSHWVVTGIVVMPYVIIIPILGVEPWRTGRAVTQRYAVLHALQEFISHIRVAEQCSSSCTSPLRRSCTRTRRRSSSDIL
jgi:hypothetical protein